MYRTRSPGRTHRYEHNSPPSPLLGLTPTRPTRDSYPAHPRKSSLSVLLNLEDLREAAYAPLYLKHKDMAKKRRHMEELGR